MFYNIIIFIFLFSSFLNGMDLDKQVAFFALEKSRNSYHGERTVLKKIDCPEQLVKADNCLKSVTATSQEFRPNFNFSQDNSIVAVDERGPFFTVLKDVKSDKSSSNDLNFVVFLQNNRVVGVISRPLIKRDVLFDDMRFFAPKCLAFDSMMIDNFLQLKQLTGQDYTQVATEIDSLVLYKIILPYGMKYEDYPGRGKGTSAIKVWSIVPKDMEAWASGEAEAIKQILVQRDTAKKEGVDTVNNQKRHSLRTYFLGAGLSTLVFAFILYRYFKIVC